ncbi:hypothetical protein AB9L15_12445 [Lysinibacillus fusiformis]|uniref:hypothetical protein n=1 Tax=Lysinibacillus fusiformis TaxID=28031 RepID=UPI000BBB3008|nr:hypothetical protein [Lysinibacillus fusiformis]PCD84350.1 hypothetical protein CNQ87_08200 [Lysinibacillus fusiformis]
MKNVFQFIPINKLADKFPENSWWASHYTDFSENDLVAYYEGDLKLPFLDLDWDIPFPQQDNVIIIFIDGHLTVDHLYNAETDGAIGLMVMGNLTAKNIAVGGQEIYVHGHLTVEDILCGSYNHGETIVNGHLQANVLVQDDEYRFNVHGQKSLQCIVNIWHGDGVFQELPIRIQDVLIDEVFYDMDDDEEEIEFSFVTLVSILKEGRSALTNLQEIPHIKKATHVYFTDHHIDVENILKLTKCILMTGDKPYFDLEEHGVHFTVQRAHIDDDGDKTNDSIYMKTSQYHYFIWLNEDQTVSLLRKSFDEGDEWWDITDLPQDNLVDIQDHWIMLLTCVNVATLYVPKIEVQYVERILQHPEIQGLDEDDDGFWDGSKYYSFRQAYMDEDGDFIHARIEIKTPDEAYYFYSLENPSYVSRHYQPPNHFGRHEIAFLNTRRWEASEQYFERFKQFMSQNFKIDILAE